MLGGGEGHDASLSQVVDDIHVQAAQTGCDARCDGHQHLADTQQVRQLGGMERPGSSEGHECEVTRIETPVDRDNPDRSGHVVVADIDDAPRGSLRRQSQAIAEGGHGRARGGRVEVDAAGQVDVAGEPAKHHVGVSDGGLRATPAVRGGTRDGARAPGPDMWQVAGIHPGHRSAARPDGDEVDGREPDGLAELRRVLRHEARLTVADHGDVRGCAADVQRDELVDGLVTRHLLGHHDRGRGAARCGQYTAGQTLRGLGARRRSGGHQPCRQARRAVHRHEAAARMHHRQPAGETRRAQSVVERAQIAHDDRHQGRVDDRGRCPLELWRLPEQLRRVAHVCVRQLLEHDRVGPFLVARIDVGVQEADREGADAICCRMPHRPTDGHLVEGLHLGSVGVQAFRDLIPMTSADQWLRRIPEDVEWFPPVVATELEHIPEAGGRQECRGSPATHDDGVGGDGRAVRDEVDLPGRDTRRMDRIQHTLVVVRRRRWGLGDAPVLTPHRDEVRIGAAGVDAYAPAHRRTSSHHLIQSA